MTVSAVTSDTATASTYEKTSGWKKAPVSPWRKNTGTMATTMISVA